MTGNQASLAEAVLPAPEAAAAHWDRVRKETARYAVLLLGGAAAAVLAMAMPAMASPTSVHDAASTGSISPILGDGDIVTGVRGTTDGNVILTGSHLIDRTTSTNTNTHEAVPLRGPPHERRAERTDLGADPAVPGLPDGDVLRS